MQANRFLLVNILLTLSDYLPTKNVTSWACWSWLPRSCQHSPLAEGSCEAHMACLIASVIGCRSICTLTIMWRRRGRNMHYLTRQTRSNARPLNLATRKNIHHTWSLCTFWKSTSSARHDPVNFTGTRAVLALTSQRLQTSRRLSIISSHARQIPTVPSLSDATTKIWFNSRLIQPALDLSSERVTLRTRWPWRQSCLMCCQWLLWFSSLLIQPALDLSLERVTLRTLDGLDSWVV